MSILKVVTTVENYQLYGKDYVLGSDYRFTFEPFGMVVIPRGTETIHKAKEQFPLNQHRITSWDWCKDEKLKAALEAADFTIDTIYLTHKANVIELLRLEKSYNEMDVPRIGDYVKRGDKYYQIASNYSPSLITGQQIYIRPNDSCEDDPGYFYLGDKWAETSGGRGDKLELANLKLTDEKLVSKMWFFCKELGSPKSNMFTMQMRVYVEK